MSPQSRGRRPTGAPNRRADKGDPGAVGPITVRTGPASVDGGSSTNGLYVTRVVQVLCDSGEKAISAGTSWSDNNDDLELTTVQIKPVLNPSNQVVGFIGRGGNDSGQTSTFTLHVFCYKG